MVPQLHKQSRSDFTVLLDRAAFVNVGSQNRILDRISLARKSGRARECLAVVSTIRFDSPRSAGARQQMAVSGAAGPKLMILDEPSMGLAPILMREISEKSRTPNPR